MLDRREFLACAALAPLVLRSRRSPEPIRVAMLYRRDVVDEGTATRSARNGIQLAWEEAQQTYALLGRSLEPTESREDALAVISVSEGAERLVTRPVLLDARARVPAGPCGMDVFRLGLAHEAPADVVLWHSSLERFGAAQLNERFRRRFGQPMDEHAWAGWFAVKLVAEAGLRADSTDPGYLREWLLGPRARFDGHKGASLAFSAQRRLLQPVYRSGADGTEELQMRQDACAPV